jgi:hypothetical protein
MSSEPSEYAVGTGIRVTGAYANTPTTPVVEVLPPGGTVQTITPTAVTPPEGQDTLEYVVSLTLTVPGWYVLVFKDTGDPPFVSDDYKIYSRPSKLP